MSTYEYVSNTIELLLAARKVQQTKLQEIDISLAVLGRLNNGNNGPSPAPLPAMSATPMPVGPPKPKKVSNLTKAERGRLKSDVYLFLYSNKDATRSQIKEALPQWEPMRIDNTLNGGAALKEIVKVGRGDASTNSLTGKGVTKAKHYAKNPGAVYSGPEQRNRAQ